MMQQLSNNDFFKTSDLALCATLCYFGYVVEGIDKSPNISKVEFIVKRDEKLDDLIKSFWSHQLTVEPVAFFNFIREVKNRIYAKE